MENVQLLRKRNPVKITDVAGKRMIELLRKNDQSSSETKIKLGIISKGKGSCLPMAYSIDLVSNVEYDDEVFDHVIHVNDICEKFTFVIDGKNIMHLIGLTIDYKDEPFKSGFVFMNPNAKMSCGCGETFSV